MKDLEQQLQRHVCYQHNRDARLRPLRFLVSHRTEVSKTSADAVEAGPQCLLPEDPERKTNSHGGNRFEKSLYDLIRGLRNHKGNERAYIQDSIRECRREIKSQDMGTCTSCPPRGMVSGRLRRDRPQGDGVDEVDVLGNVWA